MVVGAAAYHRGASLRRLSTCIMAGDGPTLRLKVGILVFGAVWGEFMRPPQASKLLRRRSGCVGGPKPGSGRLCPNMVDGFSTSAPHGWHIVLSEAGHPLLGDAATLRIFWAHVREEEGDAQVRSRAVGHGPGVTQRR